MNSFQMQLPENKAQFILDESNKYLDEIGNITGRNVIAYYSGWMKYNVNEVSINDNDKNAFMNAVYQLPREKGLDLILHTPGGNIAAAESIVSYLKSAFDGNIRAIIPQIAMSAGTMIAMACKEIIMGRQSSLGPIDPQMNGIACQMVIDEFEKAKKDVAKNPSSLGLWQTIISQYRPTYLTACENAVQMSEELAENWLTEINPNINMEVVKQVFINPNNSHSHSRHIAKEDCKNAGLPITDLENNQPLQEAVLSLHHCYSIMIDSFSLAKIVTNKFGRNYIISVNKK